MKAIVFGINGQDGFYLKSLLNNNGISVIGVSRRNPQYTIGDVSNYDQVENLIKINKPEYIFHLAANSTTNHDALFENHETIVTGSLNILESVYRHSKHSKVFISGSGLQFVNNGTPIAETASFEARDGYSMSRIQSVYAARYYRGLGVNVYVGYFFNHDSPMRSERHINQKIVLAAQSIAMGRSQNFYLGDATVKKEFTYAGDVAVAIWKLVTNEVIFEAVIGSGKAYALSNWLDLCFNYYNLDWRRHIQSNSDFIPECKILVSDPSTIYSLGWQPLVSIDGLAKMMLENKPVFK